MDYKKVLNILIGIIAALVIVLAVGFSTLDAIAKMGEVDSGIVIPPLDNEVDDQYGQFNIYNPSESGQKKDKIDVSTTGEFISVYNSFFASSIKGGGYVLEGSGTMNVYASIIDLTVRQHIYFKIEVDSKGNFKEQSGSVELTSSGYGENVMREIYYIDGITYIRRSKNVSLNGARITAKNFSGYTSYTNAEHRREFSYEQNPQLFVLTEFTVNSASLTKRRTGFALEANLNNSGLQKSGHTVRSEGGATGFPNYSQAKINIEMDVYGNVKSINSENKYTMTVVRAIVGKQTAAVTNVQSTTVKPLSPDFKVVRE